MALPSQTYVYWYLITHQGSVCLRMNVLCNKRIIANTNTFPNKAAAPVTRHDVPTFVSSVRHSSPLQQLSLSIVQILIGPQLREHEPRKQHSQRSDALEPLKEPTPEAVHSP